jgi:hypothetical protein
LFLIGVALLTAAALLGGCKRASPPESAAADTRASVSANSSTPILSDAESRYGVSPKLDPRVTYQPDVIVMERGAEAIRAPTVDGFTWTIDGAVDVSSYCPKCHQLMSPHKLQRMPAFMDSLAHRGANLPKCDDGPQTSLSGYFVT